MSIVSKADQGDRWGGWCDFWDGVVVCRGSCCLWRGWVKSTRLWWEGFTALRIRYSATNSRFSFSVFLRFSEKFFSMACQNALAQTPCWFRSTSFLIVWISYAKCISSFLMTCHCARLGYFRNLTSRTMLHVGSSLVVVASSYTGLDTTGSSASIIWTEMMVSD